MPQRAQRTPAIKWETGAPPADVSARNMPAESELTEAENSILQKLKNQESSKTKRSNPLKAPAGASKHCFSSCAISRM